jgi:hypothetical protein
VNFSTSTDIDKLDVSHCLLTAGSITVFAGRHVALNTTESNSGGVIYDLPVVRDNSGSWKRLNGSSGYVWLV